MTVEQPERDSYILFTPYLVSFKEINDRTDYIVSVEDVDMPVLDAMMADSRIDYPNNINHPETVLLILIGSGLFHFQVKVFQGLSYCSLQDEFQIYVDDAPLPYPLQFLINSFVAILIGGVLFVVYLWYLNKHHVTRVRKAGSRCQDLHAIAHDYTADDRKTSMYV
ncbi:PREDICTED: cation channel sperm-associated protein subunit beta-like [Priapulus caudatus]|uniref:Cation channel sperm-associated protein subunit beta-like n=1 Tax=Priapulus caudatus TaxID=37621 RepID=A0ABM1E636_PRICU|nr:PREDICTED: cation channel sperm-associated protein subunit beta-like [Priapulus caudatus]